MEKIDGEKATLTVQTRDNKKTGTITIVKENGVWKIDAINYV